MSPARRGVLLGAAVFVAAVAVAAVRTAPLPELGGVRLRMPWTLNDFKTAIYCPVDVFLRGGNPYDRAQFLAGCPVQDVFPLYLPSTLVLHAPVRLLPIDVAAFSYFLLTVALTVAVVRLAFAMSERAPSPGELLLVAGLLLLSRPGQWNLLLGQPALELTAATYLALRYARQAPAASGLALAISLYKPTFGVPLALLMLARGELRAVLAGAAVAAVLNLPPLLVLAHRAGGLGELVGGVVRTQQAWEGVVDPATQVYGVDAPGLIGRLLGARLPPPAYAAVAGLIIALAGWAARAARRIGGAGAAPLATTLTCLGILLSVHHHAYDLVLLAAPVVALAGRTLPAAFTTPRFRLMVLALFALLAANYVTTQSVLGHLRGHYAAWLLLASANGLALLAIFLCYIGQLRAYARSARPLVPAAA